MITRERAESRAALRALKNPLYDTGHILAAAPTNRVNFFQAPQGNPIVAAGALKTEADTNLTQAGQLGRPQEFDLYGFQLEIFNTNCDDIPNTFADLLLVYDTGVFEFFFGQQRPWLQLPVEEIPNGPAFEGCYATADNAATTGAAFLKSGEGAADAYYNFTIGKKPIPIASAENFSARLDWPSGAPTTTNLYRATCYMKGILYAAL